MSMPVLAGDRARGHPRERARLERQLGAGGPRACCRPGSRISTFSVDFASGLEEPGRPEVVLEPALREQPAVAVEGVGLPRLAEPRDREDAREVARDRDPEREDRGRLRAARSRTRRGEEHDAPAAGPRRTRTPGRRRARTGARGWSSRPDHRPRRAVCAPREPRADRGLQLRREHPARSGRRASNPSNPPRLEVGR